MVAESKNNPIKVLFKRHKYKADEVSKATGLSVSSLNRLVAGTNNDPRLSTLLPLANFFDVSIDELVSRKPLRLRADASHDEEIISHVPLIHWEQVDRIKETLGTLDFNTWDYWVIATSVVSSTTFALKVMTSALQPPLLKGATIIVDPTIRANDGDYIILSIDKNPVICKVMLNGTKLVYQDLLFKEYHEESGKNMVIGSIAQIIVTTNV